MRNRSPRLNDLAPAPTTGATAVLADPEALAAAQATHLALMATGADFAEALALAAQGHGSEAVLPILARKLVRYGSMAGIATVLDAVAEHDPFLANAGFRAQVQRREVRGDLDLGRRPWAFPLPENLHVFGSCLLQGHPDFNTLPKGFCVDRDLLLRNCPALTGLSAGLVVGGDLRLDNCLDLADLPDGLDVGGDLVLNGCVRLERLPSLGRLGGGLGLNHCGALTGLPDGLTVPKGMGLTNCTALRALPARMTVGDTLSLTGCLALTSLPSDLVVEGPLHLVRTPLAALTDAQLLAQCPGIRGTIHR